MTIVFTNHLETLLARHKRQQDRIVSIARKLANRVRAGMDSTELKVLLWERFADLDETRRKIRKARREGGGLRRGRP